MEFKELATCQIKQNVIHSFNLISSGFHVGLLGSTSEAVVLEMRHSSLVSQKFPFIVEIVKLPSKRTTSNVVRMVDMTVIYSKLNALTRQYISLDPVYVSVIAEETVEVQPIVIAWSPKNVFKQKTLAIVSSNGTCVLRRRNSLSRDWNIPFCDIDQFYFKIFPIEQPESIDTFEKFRETVENYYTTSFSWNRDSAYSNNYFVISNATGWILLFTVVKEGNISYSTKHQTSLGRISYIDFYKDFIFACSTSGVMKIYTLNHMNIEETEILWRKADRIPCKKVHFHFSTELDKWIIITTKASHILAFILSKKCALELRSTKYLGSMEITGFEMISPLEYMIVTITGSVKLVTLKKQQQELEISIKDVKYEFDKKNYQIMGLVASPNRVAWTFILFHNKPYTHPSLYSSNDAVISICSLNTRDAYTILKNETGPSDEYLDCVEIVRLEIIKDNTVSKLTQISLDNVKISKEFLRKLQLKLMVVNAEISHQKLKNNYLYKFATNEKNSLIKIIEYVYINLRLQYLRCLKGYTPFQGLSGKCLKHKLKSMQAELVTNEDIYRNVYENLNTLSDCLLMDLGSLFDTAEENCSYCNLAIDFETLLCSNLHNVPRCPISFVQVPIFTRVCCSSCNRLYFDKVELLESIFGDREEMKCTFCGFMLSVDMSDIFDENIRRIDK